MKTEHFNESESTQTYRWKLKHTAGEESAYIVCMNDCGVCDGCFEVPYLMERDRIRASAMFQALKNIEG